MRYYSAHQKILQLGTEEEHKRLQMMLVIIVKKRKVFEDERWIIPNLPHHTLIKNTPTRTPCCSLFK
jgi:hypothetical protein